MSSLDILREVFSDLTFYKLDLTGRNPRVGCVNAWMLCTSMFLFAIENYSGRDLAVFQGIMDSAIVNGNQVIFMGVQC